MKKIAILASENIYNRKGAFNAVHNRILHLKKIADYKIDVFLIQSHDNFFIRNLRGTPRREKLEKIEIDGIQYQMLWYEFSLIDYILCYKLKKKPFFSPRFINGIKKLFCGYDLVSAHSTYCGELALQIKAKYGIPYFVTWHGSDIHTAPNTNPTVRKQVKKILEGADGNFFVSEALARSAEAITSQIKKTVLYNGASADFKKYDFSECLLKRKEFGLLEEDKVVAFVGNLLPIKNAQMLPDIFKEIKIHYRKPLKFWIVGDGKLRSYIEKKMQDVRVECVFWGNQQPEKMPDFMNCIDVLVLPSRNEGLPLVTLEAMKCGANVVGSNVGGIPEAIGKEYVIDIDGSFVSAFAYKVVELLNTRKEQLVSAVFDWGKTADVENSFYQQVLGL